MTRRPNNYASQLLFAIYMVGNLAVIYEQTTTERNWALYWRAAAWPFVVVWNEVPPMISRYIAAAVKDEDIHEADQK